MIRVTIEMIPWGHEPLKYTIGTAVIRNDGTGTPTSGNYKIELSKAKQPKKRWKRATLQGFQRKRYNVWHLLMLSIAAAISGKKEASHAKT